MCWTVLCTVHEMTTDNERERKVVDDVVGRIVLDKVKRVMAYKYPNVMYDTEEIAKKVWKWYSENE